MLMKTLFPLGIASGYSFCNRERETKTLVHHIQSGKHTLLIAPRRFGKSSLTLHALQKSEYPFIEVDFYMASDEKVIETYILQAVVDLIGVALGPLDKLFSLIKQFVKNLRPKIDIASHGFKLELVSENNSDPATNIKEALGLLEDLLAAKKKRAVLFFDEFQVVGLIAKGKGVEGAIRHVAQKTNYLTFIFSGSQRHLLQTMFEDEARPLYKLCYKMTIDRIEASHHELYIQQAAKVTWGSEIDNEALQRILSHTMRHPHYLNKLCDRLFTFLEHTPTVNDVESVWSDILAEDKSEAVKEISLLSPGQKSVLHHIARGNLKGLTSKMHMMELKMTSSAIVVALSGLEEKDMIERKLNQYLILNPVVKYYAMR